MKTKISLYTDKVKRNLDREIEKAQEELESLTQVFILEDEEEIFSKETKITLEKKQEIKPNLKPDRSDL